MEEYWIMYAVGSVAEDMDDAYYNSGVFEQAYGSLGIKKRMFATRRERSAFQRGLIDSRADYRYVYYSVIDGERKGYGSETY